MKATALAAVEETGITQEILREQWDAQATAQTRPAPRMYSITLFVAPLIILIRPVKAQS